MKVSVASAVLLLAFACEDEGRDHPVNGEWVATLEIRGEPRQITFDLEARGHELEGEIRLTKSTDIVEGSIHGNRLSFKQVVPLPDGSRTKATYQGTLRGDEIDFTVDLFGSENRFTATRRIRR